MTLLQRHYVREFLKLFIVLAAGLSATFSLFGLIQKLDDFMPNDPSLPMLVKYLLLKMPQYTLSLLPVACLLCSLYTVAHAAKAKEIVAVMAAGGRVKELLKPFIAMGVLLSLLAFAVGEFVMPPAVLKAQKLKNELSGVSITVPTLLKNGILWFRAKDGSIIRIEHSLPSGDAYGNVSIFRLEDGSLSQIIEAREALWLKDSRSWKLMNGRRYFIADGSSEPFEKYFYESLGSPELLQKTSQKPSEMGIADLYRYVERLREAGFKNLRLAVDLQSKVSYPLINLIMVLIGISFPVSRKMGGFVATAIGLLISLAYWFGYSMSLSLGYAGILPPFAAAWLMPLVAGSAGIYLFRRIPE